MMIELLAAGIAWTIFLTALIAIYAIDKVIRYTSR
jgi:hypothetical protein